jgi:outer membrane lipoprotein LolB
LIRQRWIFAASLALLAACASPPAPRADYQALITHQAAREATLARRGDWSFTGRIAVSQGSNGGSGRIDWRQHGDDFDIRLSAPISRQTWRLSRADGKVRLEGLGGPREGEDAEALLADATGWRIPVAAMTAWVRGVRAGTGAELEFAPGGLPATLKQSGWTVDYRAWNQDDPALPAKVFAESGDARVRLVVDQWQTP